MSPPSLVPREDGTRKLAGLFGTEARAEGDSTADKFFYYIPGTVSGGRVPAPGRPPRGAVVRPVSGCECVPRSAQLGVSWVSRGRGRGCQTQNKVRK